MNDRPTASPRPRILDLQVLRLVAAGGVLVSHAADVTGVTSALLWQVPWTAGVDIFFIISGVIMTILTAGRFGEPGAARHFITRRIIRIVPIYWSCTALMIAAILLLPARVDHSVADPESILTSLSFIPWARPDGHVVPILSQGWTLIYEAFFYAAFALALLHRHGLRLLVGGLVLLAAAHIVIPQPLVAPYFWSDPIILEFVVGIGLARLWISGVRFGGPIRLLLAAASIALFLSAEAIGLGTLGRAVANGIPATLLAAAFLFRSVEQPAGPVRKTLIAGGDASYALYVTHTFAIRLVMLAIGTSVGSWAAMAIAVGAALIVAIVVHRLVERPVIDSLRRRFAAD